MRNEPTHATLQLLNTPSGTPVAVLGEDRSIPLQDNRFEDDFAPYAVHLYRIGR